LQREGFNPTATDEPIYVDNAAAGAYVRLDAALFARIISGQMRL
jgi:hypothetical protein